MKVLQAYPYWNFVHFPTSYHIPSTTGALCYCTPWHCIQWCKFRNDDHAAKNFLLLSSKTIQHLNICQVRCQFDKGLLVTFPYHGDDNTQTKFYSGSAAFAAGFFQLSFFLPHLLYFLEIIQFGNRQCPNSINKIKKSKCPVWSLWSNKNVYSTSIFCKRVDNTRNNGRSHWYV